MNKTQFLIFVLMATLCSHSALAGLTGVLNFVETINTPPANGDVNPYGIAFIPSGFPCTSLSTSNILIANFNNASNAQGTGTTISILDSANPQAVAGTFFTSTLPGLTSALSLLSSGYVLVGNIPSLGVNGTGYFQVGSGVIQVLDCTGKVVTTLGAPSTTHPWGMTVYETASSILIFVSNVIDGNVVRINLANPPVFANAQYTTIANGYTTMESNAAFVVGPAGLAYNPTTDVLYVAAQGDNQVEYNHTLSQPSSPPFQIYSISTASTRTTPVTKGTLVYADQTNLHGPVGIVITPQGHLITANSDGLNVNPNQTSILTEFTTAGAWYVTCLPF